MAEFDKKAATWDDDPIRVERAESIAESIADGIDLSQIEKAMEYGSGTGLLSFALKDQLKSIVLLDESEAMTEVAMEKCKVGKVDHLEPVHYDLIMQPLLETRFDLIITLLTLHHIKDTEEILRKFQQLLNPNGYLAIIDLDAEDGSFHEHQNYYHDGFERAELEKKLLASGLVPIKYEICYNLERDYQSNRRKYPLFLMISQNQ
jgi:ubiquinone/menaquinone biosynthesis C-methylase UbiE